ncbi:protein O-mannosyl-transferase 1-like [Styela clava]
MRIVHILLVALVAKSFYSIVLHIETPRSVVFDEVHYGRICKFYHQGQFHLDSEPPGAKILMQLFLPKHSDQNIWSKVGKDFPDDYPAWIARLPAAICGVLLPIIVFNIILSLKFSAFAALISSFLVVFDNALIVQSKLFLPDSIILCFQYLAICLSLSMTKQNGIVTGIILGISLSLSTSSYVTWIVILYIVAEELWKIITNGNISLKSVVFSSVTYFSYVVMTPILVYILIFYLHFALLPLPGPHQQQLSPAFQASFSNSPDFKSKTVVYGSYVTLRSVSKKCYLTSSNKRYPVQYEDGRYSSQLQMVSCTPEKEARNWWLVSLPYESASKNKKLHNDDQLQLIHSRTNNKLQANEAAGPLSIYKHEVCCYSEDSDLPYEPLWTIKLKTSKYNDKWKTLYHKIQFIHNASETMLRVTDMTYSQSGHYEVVSDVQKSNWAYGDTEWIAEELFHDDFTDEERDDDNMEIGFWDKFFETHMLMYELSRSTTTDHIHASSPFTWPLAQSTIPYWHNQTFDFQIHLAGNPISWCTGICFSVLYGLMITVWAMKMQRKMVTIDIELWTKNAYAFTILSSGWLLHMIWCLSCDRPLFLYNYLPALPFKHMLHACAVESITKVCGKAVSICYIFLMVMIIFTFEALSSVTFGVIRPDDETIKLFRWWNAWDVFLHSKWSE